jgi:hypothetical protein
MAASWTDTAYDQILDYIATATRVTIGNGTAPTSYAATYTGQIAQYTVTAGSGNGDWLKANGDQPGRKLTLLAQTGQNAGASTTADWLAFDTGAVFIGTIDADGQTANSGSPIDISQVDVLEVRDAINI